MALMKIDIVNELHPIDLEFIYERSQTSEYLEKCSTLEVESLRQIQILNLLENKQLQKCLENLDQLFLDSKQLHIQLFCLQWGIAVSEILYDMPLRKKWFDRWNQCASWSSDSWGRYLNRFHVAVQFYFDQSLKDAERLFQLNLEESKKQNYMRGAIRSQYHLGLIYRSWGQMDRALSYFNEGYAIAKKHRLNRSEQRIAEQVQLINSESSSDQSELAQVENHLRKKDFKAAKNKILECCKIRRLEKRSWSAQSEHAYLAVVCYAFKQKNRFRFIISKINDTLVLASTLRLVDQLFSLDYEFKNQLDYLENLSGYHQIIQSDDKRKVTIGAQSITQTEDREVALLLSSLIDSKNGLDKEEITKILWKNDYDPLYHDPKIYRVIHRARKNLGLNNAIVNNYGSYVLNEHLRK